MDAGVSNPIDYAPRPPLARRRWVRRLALLLLMIAAIVASWRYGPAVVQRIQILYWQRRAMNFSPPAGTVVYREPSAGEQPVVPAEYLDANSPQVPVGLIKRSYSVQGGRLPFSVVPHCWTQFLIASNNIAAERGGPVLFCHQRASRSGNRRLITVESRFPFFDIGELFVDELNPRVFALAGLVHDTTEISTMGKPFGWSGQAAPGPSLIEAGQPDPADESHFTNAYQWPDGTRGVIDGWLLDDDTVKLQDRPGPGDVKSYVQRYFARP